MRIRKIKLYTNTLEKEKQFYTKKLGLPVLSESNNHFSVEVGWTEFTFEKSNQNHAYHYCFLIPSNKLIEGMEWFEKRVPILEIEKGRKTHVFDTWNAESFYFYDGSGNIAECIVRYDLKNETLDDFNFHQLLCVNEIGMPTNDIVKTNQILEDELSSPFWKGDQKRFGANGTNEGLFLMPNYTVKDLWFPTTSKITIAPFEAQIKSRNKDYSLVYRDEDITINAL